MEATAETRAGDASGPERLAEKVAGKAKEVKRAYTGGEDRPVGSHLALVAIYNGSARSAWASGLPPAS
jgi:hypothetical protein